MIAHRVRSLSHDSKRIDTRHDYALKDIEFALFVARSLAASLDYGPWRLKDFSPNRIALEEMLQKLLGMLSHFATVSNNIKVELIRDSRVPPLFIDSRLVELAVWALLLNAVKYGKADSTVTVTTRQSASGYYLDIANEGIGISEQDAPHLFQQGYRGQNARLVSQGAGLGLNLARAIMRRHGGELSLDHRENPTVFSLFFPRSLATTPPEVR